MAASYRGARTYTSGADYAYYTMSWDGFDIWFPVSAGVQNLKDGYVVGEVTFTTTGGDSGSAGGYMTVAADTSQTWRAWAVNDDFSIRVSSQLGFKSYANVATFGTLTANNPTATSIDVSMGWYPNTVESTAGAVVQYKKTADSTWIDSSIVHSGKSGSGLQTLSGTIGGLASGTSYQFRVYVTRTTVNDTTATSGTASATTNAAAPTITTDDATGVAYASANLNATIDANSISTDVTFEWDTNSGAPYANETSPPETVATDGNQSVSKSISGLSASTPYYFRAKAVHAGGTVYGSEKTFTTPSNPAAEAASEDHMQIFEFNERKYGVQSVINLAVASPAATSSDRFFNSATPFVAGDVQISKDGGAFSNTTNLPARVGTTPNFSLTLTATEMQATTIVVMIVDQNGPAFRDAMLVIRTKVELGQQVIDATQIGGNTPAEQLIGVGTSPGLLATGGATAAGDITGRLTNHVSRTGTAQSGGASAITLDTGANGNDDWYNGMLILIIGGTGAGQARVIIDYTGSSKLCAVDSSWVTNPANDSVFMIFPGDRTWSLYRTELTALPADNASFGDKLQLIFQRFAFKITQTATVQTLLKADGSTPLATRSVSDAAGTQTVGKLA